MIWGYPPFWWKPPYGGTSCKGPTCGVPFPVSSCTTGLKHVETLHAVAGGNGDDMDMYTETTWFRPQKLEKIKVQCHDFMVIQSTNINEPIQSSAHIETCIQVTTETANPLTQALCLEQYHRLSWNETTSCYPLVNCSHPYQHHLKLIFHLCILASTSTSNCASFPVFSRPPPRASALESLSSAAPFPVAWKGDGITI